MMPIYLDVSPLERLVVIVARGPVTGEEIDETTRKLLGHSVPEYAKIIDVTGAASDMTAEQVTGMAAMLRSGRDDAARGPVAFVVNPARTGFADSFRRSHSGRSADPAIPEPSRCAEVAEGSPWTHRVPIEFGYRKSVEMGCGYPARKWAH